MKSTSPTIRTTDLGSEAETTPLLQSNTTAHDNNEHHHGDSHTVPEIHHHHKNHPKFFLVVALILFALFLISIGDYMNRAPWMRIMEDIVCRDYYRKSFPTEFENPFEPIPEERCKIADVQARVAMLRGWDETLSNIPSILTAVPYGIVADKYGRKPVLVLSLVGLILGMAWTILVGFYSNFFALEWYWAGNAFLLIGGGSAVARSMLYTILADVTSEERRSAVFFQLSASGLVATIIAIPLSWQMLKTSLFVPMLFSAGFLVLGTLVIFFLPETLDRTKISDPASVSSSDDDSADEGGLLDSPRKRTVISTLVKKIEDTRLIFVSPMLYALGISCLVQSLHGYSINILFQFASERFHWSLANSSFLIPLSSVIQFLVLIVFLPALYSLLTNRFGLSVVVKDLFVTRWSLILNILGALALSIAPTPTFLLIAVVIYAFGYGFASAVRSLITSLIRPDQVSRMYGVLAILDTVGCLVVGPLLSESYSWGLHRGGLWSGSVWALIAILFAVTCFPIFLCKLPTVEVEED